jgi:hypothetical protein
VQRVEISSVYKLTDRISRGGFLSVNISIHTLNLCQRRKYLFGKKKSLLTNIWIFWDLEISARRYLGKSGNNYPLKSVIPQKKGHLSYILFQKSKTSYDNY